MNPEVKVGELAKKAGAEIVSFTYFKVGEGIEKPVDNFAEEVAARSCRQAVRRTRLSPQRGCPLTRAASLSNRSRVYPARLRWR